MSADAPSSESLHELPPELEEQLFDAYLGDEPERAPATLDELCARHPDHADELRRVAARLSKTSGMVPDLASLQSLDDTLPRVVIPPYTILREIGRGGFGVVWLAEQREPLRRLVALKVLLPTAMTESMLQRFEIERQTLAQMQHPGIANILDAGTGPAGEPYFAMEYVDGVPITRYCDEQRVDIDSRLALFCKVCSAVQHAHQRGAIHRDLKPSNILVTSGPDAQPKIIDFGLAKALEPQPARAEPLTEAGRFVGTLEYMSPEQAAGDPVDTRTDIYALGVLLYELLTGSLPFDSQLLREGGWTAALRIIREHDPRSPSDVLAQSDIGRAAELRSTRADDLIKRLRGDLSWIVMTALEKDRERRYATVADLADDVRRHGEQLPVSVGAPSVGYVLHKFARRHRTAVTAGAAVLVALLSAIAVVVWAVVKIVDAHDEAVAQSVEAEYQEYCAQIAVAQAAMDANDAGRMREALRAAPEALRNWEWRFLAAQCDQSLDVLQTQHAQVRGIALVDNGSAAVVASMAHRPLVLEVWDLDEGRLRYSVEASKEVTSLASDPAGRLFAVGYVDGEVHLHEASTGRQVLERALTAGKSRARATFSRTGDLIAIAALAEDPQRDRSFRGIVRVFDTDSGEQVGEDLSREDRHDVQDLRLTADGSRVITCGQSDDLIVWDLESGDMLHTLKLGRNMRKTAVDAGDRYAACASLEDKNVQIWNIEDGSFHIALYIRRPATDVAFHPDGESIAVGAFDGTISLWRVADGAPLGTFRGHAAFIDGIEFSRDGSSLVSASWDGTIRRWAVHPSSLGRRLDEVPQSATSVAVDAERGIAAAGFSDGRLEARSLKTRESLWQLPTSPEESRWVEFFDGAQRLLESRTGGALRVLDAETGEVRAKTSFDGRLVDASSGGEVLALITSEEQLTVLDGATLEVVRILETAQRAVDARFLDAEGTRLLVAAGTVDVWAVGTGERLVEIPLGTPARILGVSRDRSRFCIADTLGGLMMYDTGSCELISNLSETRGYISAIHAVAFSADGTRLATFSRDHVVRIWDTARGSVMLGLADQPWCGSFLRFSGEHLFSRLQASDGGAFFVWEAPEAAGRLLERR